jgi:DNA-binding MarR family transcriptional regulator/ribosomal protein S18 acetylase RimI-like enzyme
MAAAIPTELVRAFGREFARAGGLLSPDYLESGLSLGEARCLYELGQVDELTPSELAERLKLDLGYVSRVLKRMVACGFARKHRGRDGRVRRVRLTVAGKNRLASLGRRADTRLAAWLKSKPAESIAELERGIGVFLGGGVGRGSAAALIRAARPGEIGQIIARHGELYVSELGYPESFEGYVVEAFAKFLRTFAPPGDCILVAERAGRFAGSVAAKVVSRRTVQLRFLLVEPTERGAGLGRRLVQAVLEHARAMDARRVVLDTASDLAAARALYEATGFRRTRSVRGAPWLRPETLSEHWELRLHSPPVAATS